MAMRFLISSMAGLLLILMQVFVAPADAQDKKLSQKELDQLLAPIALYPDELLTNILMAATYPLDVVQAARWVKEPANTKLKGDALAKAADAKDWDPSIKALVQFPAVLQNMSDKLDWTQRLGEAFLAQQDDVMNQIQFLRQKADEAGHLKSNKQQKVTKEPVEGGGPIYVIEPADPDIVYVPTYQPKVVYGDWWYDEYPPYAWDAYGADYVDGWWWAPAVAVAGGLWGWSHFDWHRHDINVDVDKWNRIDRDRTKISDGKWQHRPEHRGSVPYRNEAARDKFGTGERKAGSLDRNAGDRSKVESRLNDTSRGDVKSKASERGGDKAKRTGTADRTKNKAAGGATGKAKAKQATTGQGKAKAAQASKAGKQHGQRSAGATRPGGHAAAARVNRPVARGGPNRAAVAARGGGRSFGGGGRGGGGRGGGRRSDISVKHDIVLLGHLSNGLGFYRFVYNGERMRYVGVIAQEVSRIDPGAVSRDRDGYLRVDYKKIGAPFETYKSWLERGGRLPALDPR